jgi:sterol desaturase/sphingolipid hydroxylase (fatty acid hydroxylase superfamily)
MAVNPLDIDPVIGYAIPFFLISIGLEILLRRKEHLPPYVPGDAWASLAMGAGSAVINMGTKTLAFMAMLWLYAHRLFPIPNVWWAWIILFFAEDFTFYLHHRTCHEIRLFWAAHVNHHSSQQYNLAIALRQSWGELIHKYFWWMWLPFLGFHPLMVITAMTISLIYQFFLHTETLRRLPKVIEFIFNTPSHHRVHHAKNVRYLDRNHAGILIIWDRLLGTFEPERDSEAVVYGITTDIHTNNPLKIATHEYVNLYRDIRRAPGLRAKLMYLFAPPGWSHDGSSRTAREMREEMDRDR